MEEPQQTEPQPEPQPESPNAPQSFRPQWDTAARFVDDGLKTIRRIQRDQETDDPKFLYELWRVFAAAIAALKRVQDGRIQTLLEDEHERQAHAETNNETASDEYTQRTDALLEEMQRHIDDQEESEDD